MLPESSSTDFEGSSEEEKSRAQRAYGCEPDLLPSMMSDPNPSARVEVAARIAPEYIPKMVKDAHANVRRITRNRLAGKMR